MTGFQPVHLSRKVPLSCPSLCVMIRNTGVNDKTCTIRIQTSEFSGSTIKVHDMGDIPRCRNKVDAGK